MMSTKSKHKPVTLAKSPVDFSTVEANIEHNVGTGTEGADVAVAHDEKPLSKSPKSSKTKAPQEKSDHAGAAPGSNVIAVYRTLAERSLDQARQAVTKAREEANILSDKLGESSTAITGGTSAVQSYVVKAMQTQADDLFGYFRALADVKTISDAIELQSSQSRKTLDASLRQFKDISALMNDMVVKASTPIRSVLPHAKS